MSKTIFERMTGIGSGLLLLLGTLLVGLFIAQSVGSLAGNLWGAGSRPTLLVTAVSQDIFAFILPAWLTLILLKKKPGCEMGIKGFPDTFTLLIILAVYVVSIPGIDMIVNWNQSIPFEGVFKGIGEKIREMEELNGGMVHTMLATDNIGGLLVNILIIGVLTGIAEEFFFRGCLQKVLTENGVGRDVAVWTAAVIFSFMHFEFFGFFPRLLLGAWFGYLFSRTGTVWASACAHALNNSVAAISFWLTRQEGSVVDYDALGSSFDGFPWVSIVSVIATALLIRYWWSRTAVKTAGERIRAGEEQGLKE